LSQWKSERSGKVNSNELEPTLPLLHFSTFPLFYFFTFPVLPRSGRVLAEEIAEMIEHPRKPDVPRPPDMPDIVDMPSPEVNPAPPPDIPPVPVPEHPESHPDIPGPR
jgi:hypothetical protein